MIRDTRIAFLQLGGLVAALRANAPDLFKSWLSGGVQDLDEDQAKWGGETQWMALR